MGALLAGKGKPRGWGKVGRFGGLHLERTLTLRWTVTYLEFPLKLFEIINFKNSF